MSPASEGVKEFGNMWESLSNEIAPSTSIYADLDVVGTLLTFPDVIQSDRGGGEIVDAVLYDTSSVTAPLELLLFSTKPTAATKTATGDNATLILADTDLPKVCGAITFSTGGVQHLFGDNAVHFADTDLPKAFYTNERSLYGVLLSRGTPTYSCGNIMGVKLIVKRDSK
jgi:hypothetical protein